MSYPPQQPYDVIHTGPARRPGRTLLVLALISGVLALGLGMAGGITLVRSVAGVASVADDFQRVDYSEDGSVIRFDRVGMYIAYDERTSDAEPFTGRFRLSIVSEDGTPVEIEQYTGAATYNVPGRHATAVFTFHIGTPGRYAVRASTDLNRSGATMAFGEGILAGVQGVFTGVGTGLLLIGGAAVAVAAALILLIVGLVKRGKPPLAHRQANYYPPPGYYPPQGPPPQ